jgi:hypothetical protein
LEEAIWEKTALVMGATLLSEIPSAIVAAKTTRTGKHLSR